KDPKNVYISIFTFSIDSKGDKKGVVPVSRKKVESVF
ncbi:MAG: hypothetical protein RL359_49, partial [Actinomycetota bacterium]